MKITKTESGKWTTLAYYMDRDGKQHRKRFTGSSKSDVKDRATRWQLENHDDQHSAPKLLEIVEKYIENKKSKVRETTYINSKLYADKLGEVDDLKDIRIDRITTNVLNTSVESWCEKNNYSISTAKEMVKVAILACKFYDENIHLQNRMKPNTRSWSMPTDEDIRRIVEASKGTEIEGIILASAFGSLRRGEACALTLEDIGENTISVSKTYARKTGGFEIEHITKTDAGMRTTYISKSIADRLKEICKANGGRIFTKSYDNSAYQFYKLLDSIGVKHFKFHNLRSYYATTLHRAGVPDKYVAKMGGWSDVKTLQRFYQKAAEDHLEEYGMQSASFFDKLLNEN